MLGKGPRDLPPFTQQMRNLLCGCSIVEVEHKAEQWAVQTQMQHSVCDTSCTSIPFVESTVRAEALEDHVLPAACSITLEADTWSVLMQTLHF